MRITIAAILGVTTLVVIAAALGARRWERETQQLRAELESRRVPVQPLSVDFRELATLPPPVQRYFRAALRDGQPMVVAARIRHAGTFNMKESASSWRPFTSTQRVVTQRPGFDWDGRITMLPGVPVRVHDAYVAGTGVLHAALLGLVTVADLRGGGDLARGELLRFLAEAAWYPTALLPSQGVVWAPIDDRSARMTLTDGPIEASMTVTFGADGLVERVRADARGRTVAGRIEMAPWIGHFSNYAERDGMRIPLDGEVAWELPAGRLPYWRGHIAEIAYEFAR